MKIATWFLSLMVGALISLPAATSAQLGSEPLSSSPAPSAVSVIFNEQFKGDELPSTWKPRTGEWLITENRHGRNDYLSSLGLAKGSATIVHGEDFTDFTFTAKMKRAGSNRKNANRLIVRAGGVITSDGHYSDEYSFNYSRNGTFAVFERVNGSIHTLAGWESSDAIRKGTRWNKLSVTARGEVLSFYINDQLVWEGEDSSHDTGRVGISFYNHPDSTGNELIVDWAKLEVFTD